MSGKDTVPDRTATTLLRLARDPASGRLRCGTSLDIGLRASLFADLILGGRIVSPERSPLPTPIEPTGDHFLDTLRKAVSSRPGVSWMRWFRHVRADRVAVVGELIEQGRWQHTGGRLRPSYDDKEPAAVLELSLRLAGVAEQREAPRDTGEVTLAIIATMCGALGGRPRPRALRRDLRPLLDHIGLPEDPIRRAYHADLRAASIAMRRARTGRVPG